ncbi:hypothetical protein ACHAXT_001960 [Thalassiosira profunda]
MPSTLRDAVRSALSSLLQERQASHDDVAQDVYRALREEAHLMLERERACDALDADPFELTRAPPAEADSVNGNDCKGDEDEAQDAEDLREKQKNKEMIARVKGMLRVASCTRTSTPEGYSAVRAVVQLDNDGKMQGVEGHVRLHFAFLREPQHNDAGEEDGDGAEKVFYADADAYFEEEEAVTSGQHDIGDDGQPAKKRKRTTTEAKDTTEEKDETDDEISGDGDEQNVGESSGGFAPKTIVTYQIEYSVDYGKKEKLLGLDIYAPGEFPSIEEAVPLIDDGEEGGERDGSGNEALKRDDEKCCNGDAPAKRDGSNAKDEFEDVEMSDDGGAYDKDTNIDGGNGDRFGIFIDPEAVVAFLDRVNMNLNEQSVFYFLLTFPFYEHEWDIAGFLLSTLEYDDEEDSEVGEENVEREDCK